MFRKIKIKWQVWRRSAIDIWSISPYPADVLSNLCNNKFTFNDVSCGSMEGFLQSLKQKDIAKQQQICSMEGKSAKKMSTTDWQTDQIVWWKGQGINRHGDEFLKLVTSAYQAMFNQNERFRTALMSTSGMTLYHSRGESNPYKTILTENELCSILMNIRTDYDKRKKDLPVCSQPNQEEKYPIPVSIGDFVLNIAVTQSSEEYYRQAVKTVNEEILKYHNVYPDASKEQLLAAIAIENVFNKLLNE